MQSDLNLSIVETRQCFSSKGSLCLTGERNVKYMVLLAAICGKVVYF